MSTWYPDSLFLIHYDRAFSPANDPPAGSGLDPAQIRRLLQSIQPDAVHYPAKDHSGYVPYDTRFGNALPYYGEEPAPDVLRVYRDVTRELEIRLILGYSGLVDRHAVNWRPGWQRLANNFQPYPNGALCPNSGYVEELLLPQLEEIIQLYMPDGIWMDAENWTVSPCYCSSCETEFQMLYERSAPYDRGEHLWDEWLKFQRDSFQNYLIKVARYLHDRDTGLVYASNGAYSTQQPETPTSGIDRLTRDLSPAFSLRQAGMEARFFDRQGVPFDLATPVRASARPWSTPRAPALPSYLKTFPHLAQEGAVILANGGRWTVWTNPERDDALPERAHAVIAEAATFARERAPWLKGTESAAYVAVLHSATTHRLAGNGLYDPGPSLDRVRGAHQALTELHHPHDIVSEESLLRDLDRYSVVVLPEQVALPDTLDEPLMEWVRRGGRLIASGRVATRILEDLPTYGLEELLGVRWTGSVEPRGYFLHRDLPMEIGGPVYSVSLIGAEVAVPQLRTGHESLQQELEYPALTRNLVGEGQAYYIAADFFAAYHRCQYPGFREFLGDVLARALPQSPLLTTAPPTVEMTLRVGGGRTLLHMVNHAPGESLAQNHAFIERVPLTEPFSITLTLPEKPRSVFLQPGDVEPEWSWNAGTFTVFIPPLHLHAILVVE